MAKLHKKDRSLYRALTPVSDYDDIWDVNETPDENSTVKDNSLATCDIELSKNMLRSYGRDKIYNYIQKYFKWDIAIQILKDCSDGIIKIHDLHGIDFPYCYAFSMSKIVYSGLPFLTEYNAKPPKDLFEYVQSVINFVGYASNQMTGAISLPDFFVYFDWFSKKKKYKKSDILHLFKQFISSMNYEYRGNQPPFTNINLYDHDFLNYLFKDIVYPDLTQPDIDSIYQLQKLYIDWIVEESKNNVFTFPIHTVNFHVKSDHGKRKIIDEGFLDYVSEKNCYNGIFNIYTGSLTSMSSCCRLRSDLSKLPYQNSFGAGGISIGSHRVVTLNLPYIALLAGSGKKSSMDDFNFLLNEYLEKCIIILKAHRYLLKENNDCHTLPLYDYGFMELDRQFSTVGFIGLYECCQILNKDMEYELLGAHILKKINDRLAKEKDSMFNLEQIPGETTASGMLRKIKKVFKKYDNGSLVLSNQYIPLTKSVDIVDRIYYQGVFDNLSGGGSVAHLNVSESLSKDQMSKLIRYAASKGCIYFAFNMDTVKCNDCGKVFIGKYDKCPVCSGKIQNYTRVVGFLTPVNNWTDERQVEYTKRQFYTNESISSVR